MEILAHRTRRGVVLAAFISTCLTLGPGEVRGQEMSVSIADQVTQFTRVLQFDRTFEARSADGLVFGILYQSDYPPSIEARDAFAIALRELDFTDARGFPPIIVTLEMGPRLATNLEDQTVDLLYVTPIQGLDILSLISATRRLDILSLSGVPYYATSGLSVGLEFDGTRNWILINREAAAEEDSTFPPTLLRMARIIQEIR